MSGQWSRDVSGVDVENNKSGSCYCQRSEGAYKYEDSQDRAIVRAALLYFSRKYPSHNSLLFTPLFTPKFFIIFILIYDFEVQYTYSIQETIHYRR